MSLQDKINEAADSEFHEKYSRKLSELRRLLNEVLGVTGTRWPPELQPLSDSMNDLHTKKETTAIPRMNALYLAQRDKYRAEFEGEFISAASKHMESKK